MTRRTFAILLLLAAGICAYRGSSPYIEARMEQDYLKRLSFPEMQETGQKVMSIMGMEPSERKWCSILHRLILKP